MSLHRDYAETVVSSADALLKIINDILDFSKIEAGMLSFDDLAFDPREAVEGTIELLAPAARRKGLELVVLMPADIPAGLRGDPGRLRQVLANLIGNAVKVTEHGVVRVLLVDDNDMNLFVLREQLDTWGVCSESARCGSEALRRSRAAAGTAIRSTCCCSTCRCRTSTV